MSLQPLAAPTGRRVTRDTLLNLVGMGLPLLAALACIPALIQALGLARFGVLALVWAVSSYFGLFDLGLGRLLAQQVARAWQLGQYRRCGALAGSGLAMLAVLGLLAALLMAAAAPVLAPVLGGELPAGEVHQAIVAMAVATPAALLGAGLRGVLEARGAFVAVNLLRLPLGLFNFVGPLALVQLGHTGVDQLAWLLCAGRWLAAAAHAWVAVQRLASRAGPWWPRRRLARRLAGLTGWMTLSNLASPLMGYADRFVLGAVGSAAAVAYYVTPLEVVGRLAILPAALTAVLLPAFAAGLAAQPGGMARGLHDRSLLALFCALWPLCCGIALFAEELLTLWLGADFARHSAPLLQLFAAGMLLNGLAYVPNTLLMAAARVRRLALIHLAELLPFLALLVVLSAAHGAWGAALAWLLRIALDTALHFAAAAPLLRDGRAFAARGLGLLALAALGFAGIALAAPAARAAWWLLVLLAAGLLYRRAASGAPAEVRA